MPWAPVLVCIQPGCRVRHAGPRCPTHAGTSSRNHYGVPRQQRGLGAAFDRFRPQVIERDGGRCRLRLAGCTVSATTADHILPRSRGGRTTLENLRASCGHCNSARGDGHRDTQAGQSSVTRVTRVADGAGRGIRSVASAAEAMTAALLGISPETVRWHLSRLFERCGCVDEAQAGYRHREELALPAVRP